MRAAIKRGTRIVCDEVAAPEPGPGQVLVKTLACGICGSDLHMLHFADKMVAMGRRSGAPDRLDPNKDIVFGHEFSAEILDHGPGSAKALKVGTRVVSMPILMGPQGMDTIGYSNTHPGGFAEQMVLFEPMLLEIPNGLASEHAALTEPFAVGLHAVEKAEMPDGAVSLVIGCGPVGLAVIAALKLKGHSPIYAADFSPARRKLAEHFGADHVIDPKEKTPHGCWAEAGVPITGLELMAAMMGGKRAKLPVVFECVGVPGVLQSILDAAPPHTRIVVAGVCMEEDKIEPAMAINKQIEMRFVLGYSPDEFAGTLRAIAEGAINAAPIITDTVGLSEVDAAFKRLGNPERDVKILVDPGRT